MLVPPLPSRPSLLLTPPFRYARMTHARLLLALTVLLASTTACHRKRPAPAAPAPVTTSAGDDDAARREAEAREAARRAAEEARLRAEREAAERARAAARDALQATVYFSFDRSDLDTPARAVLEAKLPVLQANRDVRIHITGHTDERGSDEYNLALGQRRAAAAKRFLTQRGVDEGRIEIASLGEERPVCTESAEACWAQNRRDAFEITVGSIAAAPAVPRR
jgi:peptidoglycan-associated lipoprotein